MTTFENTRPAQLGGSGEVDPWAEFRVDHPREVLAILRQLRDGSVPVNLNAPDGAMLSSCLWALDDQRGRLNFAADADHPMLGRLVEENEAVAVAYLESVKLQFDLADLLLVRSAQAAALQARVPREIYRFQRRGAYRVRTLEQHAPTAGLRHPSIPEMTLALRVLDVSAGGCALLLPADVPPFEPGRTIAGVRVELDADTRFVAGLHIHHVTRLGDADRGSRLGCEWTPLDGAAARALQRYIDQTQKRRRLLQL
jgi:c-di-GMP-binding flagellar brake protein YcgR